MGTTAAGTLMRREGKNGITDPSLFVFTVTVTDDDPTMSIPFEVASGYSVTFGDVTAE